MLDRNKHLVKIEIAFDDSDMSYNMTYHYMDRKRTYSCQSKTSTMRDIREALTYLKWLAKTGNYSQNQRFK
jgi:hypothetical protein